MLKSAAGRLVQIAFEQGIHVLWIAVLAGQAAMQCFEPTPSDGAASLGFADTIAHQQPQGFAIDGVTGFQFSDG